jgi:hypothetical protein
VTDSRNTPPTGLALIAAIVALLLIAGAAVLLAAGGDPFQQRVVIFLGLIGTTVASLVALLRSDQAASRLNGGLDDRIQLAVLRAHAERRATDPGALPASHRAAIAAPRVYPRDDSAG